MLPIARRSRRLSRWGALCPCLIFALFACKSEPAVSDGEARGGDSGAGAGGDADPGGSIGGSSGWFVDIGQGEGGDSSSAGGSAAFDLSTLTIVYDGPATLDVMVGEAQPTATFTATVSGHPVEVGWSVDRGELATISQEGVLTPSGAMGGFVTVRAGLNDHVVERRVQIRLFAVQNGPSASQSSQVAPTGAPSALTVGGGIGGVGGEGLGQAIADTALSALLAAGPTHSGTEAGFKLLYPYEGTLFPRGLLAPLLMWSWDENDADAVRIELSTASGNYSWSGTFGRPAIIDELSRPFIRHPIPQDAWAAATESAGDGLADGTSDPLLLSLTIAHGGVVYGPLTRTLAVAPGRLSGTVYYNSYGTGLVTNFAHTRNGEPNDFGAAVLGIRAGDTGPSLVSGYDSSDHSGCRACHTVSAQGTNLLVQGGEDERSSWWNDLVGGEAELGQGDPDEGLPNMAWAGLSPDGALALTNSVDLSRHNDTVHGAFPWSTLLDMTVEPPQALAASGWPEQLRAALPNFSPDGRSVAFAYLGRGDGALEDSFFDPLPPDGSKLVVMDFDRGTLAFSNPRVVATGTVNDAAEYRPHGAGFPSLAPGGHRVLFMDEVRGAGATNETYIATRDGARGELWWASTQSEVGHALNYANGRDHHGVSYLPKALASHGLDDDVLVLENGTTSPIPQGSGWDDTTLNYEPTVNPVATGGYAWLVFTSRRMYGNLATQNPWLSDPRHYDFKSYDHVTTKKLWVAAIRLDASADEDPSFPAFYLPGQELVAGNARGFWVLDPCRDDGVSCESGDQCCGGFCQTNGPEGALVCSDRTTTANCSAEQERCAAAADCCAPSSQCINGFCARPAPPIIR